MNKPPTITLQKTLKWLDKTEGRDKFCKAIQYSCRFLKYQYGKKGDKVNEKKIDALFCAMRDARKLFRLFKSLKEYGKLMEVVGKIGVMRRDDFLLNVVTRVFFLLYWLFDNLSILSKLNLISLDPKQMGKKGSTCWFIALLSTFILSLKNIILFCLKISHLRTSTFTTSTSQTNEKMKLIKDTEMALRKEVLVLVKTVGDMLPAGQGCQFWGRVFGVGVNQGWCGIGGLVSAVITSYQLYQ